MAIIAATKSLIAWAFICRALSPVFVAASTIETVNGEVRIIRDIRNYDEEMRKCLLNGTICVPICCEPGFYLSSSECIKDNNSLAVELQLPSIYSATRLQPLNGTVLNYTRLHGLPCKPENVFTDPENGGEWYYYLDNGEIFIPYYNETKLLEFSSFCFTSEMRETGSVKKIAVCNYDYQMFRMDTDRIISLASSVMPIPFLIITFVVYSVIPELNNLHGSLLKTHVAVFCLSYIIIAVLNVGYFNRMHGMSLCTLIATTLHFLQFSMFIWLNVICIDIWLTFGSSKTLRATRRPSRQYLLYSIYAWGISSILTAICIAVEFIPGISKNVIRPQFGIDLCWIHTRIVHAYFFYLPVGVTLICNISLFISTSVKIIKQDRDTAIHFNSTESQRHNDDKQRFYICIKLFILMGIFWTIGVLWKFFYVRYDSLEVTFTLQGPILFFILVLNARTRRLVLKHFSCKNVHCFPSISRSLTLTSTMSKWNFDPAQSYRVNHAFENYEKA